MNQQDDHSSPPKSLPPEGRNRRISAGAIVGGALSTIILVSLTVAAFRSPEHSLPPIPQSVDGTPTSPPMTPNRHQERVADERGQSPRLSTRSAEELFAAASPGVVRISIKNKDGKEIGAATGFFISGSDLQDQAEAMKAEDLERGLGEYMNRVAQPVFVVTNYHVIHPAVSLSWTSADGREGEATRVILEDPIRDIAVLCGSIAGEKDIVTLPLADVNPRVGSTVLTIGNPLSLDYSLSKGIISGVRHFEGTTWLQSTVAISPGSSGGPLMLEDGRVVGVMTSIHREAQNINFAVPVASIRMLLDKPIQGRHMSDGATFRDDWQALGWRIGSEFIESNNEADWLYKLYGAWVLVNEKRYSEAIAAVDEVRSAVPAKVGYMGAFIQGMAHYHIAFDELLGPRTADRPRDRVAARRHLNAAISALNDGVKARPDMAYPHYLLFYCYSDMREWSNALLAANELVRLVPRCAEAYECRSKAFQALGNLQGALDDAVAAAELDSKSIGAWTQLGSSYFDAKEYSKALAAYEMLRPLGVDWPAEANIANVLRKMGRFDEAERAYRRAGELGMPADWVAADIARLRREAQ